MDLQPDRGCESDACRRARFRTRLLVPGRWEHDADSPTGTSGRLLAPLVGCVAGIWRRGSDLVLDAAAAGVVGVGMGVRRGAAAARRCAPPVLLLAAVAGCATADPGVSGVQDVFFTDTLAPGGMSYTAATQMGPRVTRFGPTADKVVLVIVVDPHREMHVRGTLVRPDGREFGTWQEALREMLQASRWRAHRRWWNATALRQHPGEWSVRLWVNDHPAGVYRFQMTTQ